MSIDYKLRSALNSIADSMRALKRAKANVQTNPQLTGDHCIRKALRDLEDAKTDIEKAIRETKA